MIDATGYVMTAAGGWRAMSTRRAGLTASASSHAERAAMTAMSRRTSDVFLIVVNAFPCTGCHEWFLEYSRSWPSGGFIIKVIADNGEYSREHIASNDIPNRSTPAIIYYFGGSCSFVGLWTRGCGAAPSGFPWFPEFDDVG